MGIQKKKAFYILVLLSTGAVFFGGCRPVDKQKIILSFWHGIENPENCRLFQKKISEFEKKNPHIKIETQNIGAQDKAMPKIVTAIAAESPSIMAVPVSYAVVV